MQLQACGTWSLSSRLLATCVSGNGLKTRRKAWVLLPLTQASTSFATEVMCAKQQHGRSHPMCWQSRVMAGKFNCCGLNRQRQLPLGCGRQGCSCERVGHVGSRCTLLGPRARAHGRSDSPGILQVQPSCLPGQWGSRQAAEGEALSDAVRVSLLADTCAMSYAPANDSMLGTGQCHAFKAACLCLTVQHYTTCLAGMQQARRQPVTGTRLCVYCGVDSNLPAHF